MSLPDDQVEIYERTQRRVCPDCGHSYVWHGSLLAPSGCSIRECSCDEPDPDQLNEILYFDGPDIDARLLQGPI